MPAGHIALFMGLAGTVFFGIRARNVALSEVPASVWIIGALVGITQYLTVLVIQASLRRGPLMPVWCAVGLNFLLPTVYAAFFLKERPDCWQLLGLGTGVLTVLVAALNVGLRAGAPMPRRPPRDFLMYGLLLAGIIVFNSANPIAMKHLDHLGSAGENLVSAYGTVYYALLYLLLAVCLLGDMLITRALTATSRFVFVAGPLGAAGSIACLSLLWASLALPTAVLFTINATVSILCTAVLSVLFLGERTRPAWYLTVGLAILTVLLVNLGALAG